MSQNEYAMESVPVSVWVAQPKHIETEEDTSSISMKIGSGRAYLKVVAYPWGVEFDVLDKETSR